MMKLIAFPFAAFGGAILALICLAAWMVILPVGAAYAVVTLYRRSLRRSASIERRISRPASESGAWEMRARSSVSSAWGRNSMSYHTAPSE